MWGGPLTRINGRKEDQQSISPSGWGVTSRGRVGAHPLPRVWGRPSLHPWEVGRHELESPNATPRLDVGSKCRVVLEVKDLLPCNELHRQILLKTSSHRKEVLLVSWHCRTFHCQQDGRDLSSQDRSIHRCDWWKLFKARALGDGMEHALYLQVLSVSHHTWLANAHYDLPLGGLHQRYTDRTLRYNILCEKEVWEWEEGSSLQEDCMRRSLLEL